MLTGAHLVTTFPRRLVQPLQARAHPMFEYAGDDDSTRVLSENFSTNELIQAVKMLTGLKVKVGELVSPIDGYTTTNSVPEVFDYFYNLFHLYVPLQLKTSLCTYFSLSYV